MANEPDDQKFEITPQVLLKAYACGVFPMAESADDPTIFWLEPEHRGNLPLDSFYIPKRLRRTVRSDRFEIRVSTDFQAVIESCAAPTPDREETWINGPIKELYGALFYKGYCQTIEVYKEGNLVGGLYGVNLGSAFFGETMFSRERDASKVALVHLVARLIKGGFTLLDTQFLTDHLAQFGVIEIDRDIYMEKLEAALQIPANFFALQDDVSGAEALAIIDDASAL
ncbi:leucyl/phenylalanyl-tRNA--protein transferase [Rhodobacteraceae bacterium RKSG542]|uniref:leucyl/phenylalanyl-tRNA--protein transferase n=1 Tax=Pseudovibrio flavus TaxID=2529854 RepID=UPI0012BB7B5F|nr:leucyl/phenylalanyl-tRNA--protein transferase [Pseudovibrio flavus]MTI17284.1 leucyl/phenylalanyl-tRNA--protein transferase [Pseudovibrio flavus]